MNYKEPIDYLTFYEEFASIKAKDVIDKIAIERKNISNHSLKFYEEIKRNKVQTTEEAHEEFCQDNKFINLLNVYCFITESSRSTRRRDFFYKTVEYFLFYKNIRVEDEYIKMLLPKTVVERESEYNDSTPGALNEENTRYLLSHLETERFLDKYDIEDHCSVIANKLKISSKKLSKVEKQLVFHEFGHIFGFLISKLLNYDFGIIKEVALFVGNPKSNDYKFQKTFVRLSSNLFRFKHGIKDEDREFDMQRIKFNLNSDRKRLLNFIMYILFGGVFNIFYHKLKPTYGDFVDVFFDSTENEEYGEFKSKAGNDFTKIKMFRLDLDWGNYDFEKFKFMSLELFYILDKHLIFYHLTKKRNISQNIFSLEEESQQSKKVELSVIECFEKEFNGKITVEPYKIERLLKLIKNSIPQKNLDRFLIEINLLIDKYDNDIHKNN